MSLSGSKREITRVDVPCAKRSKPNEAAAEYDEIKSEIIAMVKERRPFNVIAVFLNRLTIEKICFISNTSPDTGKSVLWWLSWAVSMGYPLAFELIWMKWMNLKSELSLQDFRSQALEGPEKGQSAQCLLALGSRHHPKPFNLLWQNWGPQITANDLRSKAENEPEKNLSMIAALIHAALENKIKREVIEDILRNVPYICSREDLESSMAALISQHIQAGCDWAVRLKRVIDARNAFFEGLAGLTANSTPNDFANVEKLAHSAQQLGYLNALYDADTLICIISAAQKNDWTSVFSFLQSNAANETIMSENVYNTLSKLSKKENHFLIINQINQCFGRNRQYNHEDFSYQYNKLQGFKRFKPSALFISHALVKKGADQNPLTAMQFILQSTPLHSPNIVKLNSINCLIINGSLAYDAMSVDDQKMLSTDIFNIEIQTKVGAVFVCENYDLVFFAPKIDRGYELGLFGSESIEIFKQEFKDLSESSTSEDQALLDETCPVVRGGERDLELANIHMRQIAPDPVLKESDQAVAAQTIPGKTIEVYKEFCHFYSAFFSEKMLQITRKIYDNSGHFAPEVLHAIAKMFHRTSENHYDIHNLAIAPKWVNSLMMVIECALQWHAIHAPFAKLHLKTLFKTFPMHHVLREGKIEATLKTRQTEVKISKELHPYQTCPSFPRITDITQATFVLNCLLNGQAAQQIPINELISPQRALTAVYDQPPARSGAEPAPGNGLPLKRVNSY